MEEEEEGGRATSKVRILALHGYRQNGASFRAKTGAFRKCVAKLADVSFLTGPHPAKGGEGEGEGADEADGRGWWFNSVEGEGEPDFKATRVSGPAVGFSDSLRAVERAFAESPEGFDGLLGFSQGACLVAILAAMQQKGMLAYKFKFAIIVSGFCSGSLVHKGFYDDEIGLPSLHVFGETDKIIPKEMSESLARLFADPTVVEHDGGHYLACSAQLKTHYRDFLRDVREELDNYRMLHDK